LDFAKIIVLLRCPSVVLIIYLLNPATMLGFCQRCPCRKWQYESFTLCL